MPLGVIFESGACISGKVLRSARLIGKVYLYKVMYMHARVGGENLCGFLRCYCGKVGRESLRDFCHPHGVADTTTFDVLSKPPHRSW